MGGLFSSPEPQIQKERSRTSYYQEPTNYDVYRVSPTYSSGEYRLPHGNQSSGIYQTRHVEPSQRASGLFPTSSEAQRQRERPQSSNYQAPAPRTYRQVVYEPPLDARLARHFESFRIECNWQPTRQVKPPERVRRDPGILNIQDDVHFNPGQVVTFIEITESAEEFREIRQQITNKHNFKIDSVQRIENPYLKRAYELKKEQKRREYPFCEERWLFHGTKRENVSDICKKNFNWRLCRAHKYGMGVSFSPNSTYASNYSDEDSYHKIMIVAKVLVGRSCFGHENMVLPEDGCDTSKKGYDGIVLVKYEDNEFCPWYKITYHLMNPNQGKKWGKKKKNNQVQVVFPDYLLYDY